MKKLLSLVLTMCIVFTTFAFAMSIGVSANISLTDEEISEKNYPLPEGYHVKSVLATYDTGNQIGAYEESRYKISRSIEEGTYFDISSKKITTKSAYMEISSFTSSLKFDGVGFMFWYKSDSIVTFRLRSNKNVILLEGNLAPCVNGQWVTYYYNGNYNNINWIKPNASIKDLRDYVYDSDTTCNFKLMFGDSNEHTVYIDEFITIEPLKTPADEYKSDEEFLKFSLNKLSDYTKAVGKYSDDGSVVLSSEYGSTTNNSPFTATYNVDSEQVKKSIAIAKSGSGYLQIKVDNISCKNSSDNDAFGLITVMFNGTNKVLKKYSYGSNTSDIYRINVADIENPESITSVTVALTGTSIKDVQFRFSPITVFKYEPDEIIMQAEDLSPKSYLNGVASDSKIFVDDGNNNKYAYVTNGKGMKFTLPELEVGEYEVYARCLARSDLAPKYTIALNNLIKYNDVLIADSSYSGKGHISDIPLGTFKITKSYSDGPTELRFKTIPNSTDYLYIDYFSFKKTDTEVEAEPSSNFLIKEYPEIENYEVKKVLNTYDTYINSDDNRYYKSINYAGYVGDSNAYNLNSYGTYNKVHYDNNDLWSSSAGLDGNGIRFWYKSSSNAVLQFKKSSTVVYTVNLYAQPNGAWKTIYFTDLVSNGDLSNINKLALKTSSTSAYYIDELHTIHEKLGEVIYELNGDETASVVGYNLRLEDVVIADTYNGCPVTIIKSGALSNTVTLKSVTLPNSITTIEDGAFENDLNLSEINLGNNLISIGENAFSNCNKLKSVVFPNSITSIASNAFANCSNLIMEVTEGSYAKSYAVNNSINYKCENDDYVYSKNSSGVTIEEYKGNSENIVLPEKIDGFNVIAIGKNAFEDNAHVKSIDILNVVSVGEMAFSNCVALETVKMSSVQSIGANAFSGCISLKSVNLGNSIKTIGSKAFYNNSSIERITLPQTLESIANDAFAGCSNSIVADVVKDSYAYEYVNSKGTAMIQIPATQSEFKYSLFKYEATVITYTGNNNNVNIPYSIDGYTVVAVGKNAFENDNNITYVSFPDKCKLIDEKAFYNCTSLSNFDINNVTTIGKLAFGNCASLGNITLTNIVVYASNSFDGCPDINITIEQTQFLRTAMELTNSWHAGINLGNTFDACKAEKGYGTLTVDESEKLWGAPKTTQAMINFLADGGFDVFRFPVSWFAFVNDDDNYKIDADYMARIKEVVDWAIAKDMYVILNVHHDTVHWLDLNKYSPEVCTKFERIWEQIAYTFKDYDEHLIFEALNEARAGNDWDANSSAGLFDKFNDLQKRFYRVVRNSGGYNDVRYLMLETYGAQAKTNHCNRVWYPSLEEDNHIMLSVHHYNNNIGEQHFLTEFGRGKTAFVDNGIPCVIGETGQQNYDPYFDDEHARWSEAVLSAADKCGMKVIFWDDHGSFQMFKRNTLEWQWPAQIEAIMNHVYAGSLYKVTIDDKQVDYTDNQLILPASSDGGFVAYTDGENFYNSGDVLNISKDISLKTLSIGELTMQYGAAMRLSDKTGIRFYTNVDEEKINVLRNLGAEIRMGTIIAHSERIADYNITLSTPLRDSSDNLIWTNVPYTSNVFYTEKQFNGIVGSIVKIRDNNVNVQFVGRGYVSVKIGNIEKVFYADYSNSNIKNNSRSVAYIAYMMQQDSQAYDMYCDYKEIIDKYANMYLPH